MQLRRVSATRFSHACQNPDIPYVPDEPVTLNKWKVKISAQVLSSKYTHVFDQAYAVKGLLVKTRNHNPDFAPENRPVVVQGLTLTGLLRHMKLTRKLAANLLILALSCTPFVAAEIRLSEVSSSGNVTLRALKGGVLPLNRLPSLNTLPQTFESTPNFGYVNDDKKAWLAMRVFNDTELSEWFLAINAEAADYIDVYSVATGQPLALNAPLFVAGDRRPSDLRLYSFPGYLVPLIIEPGTSREIYIAAYGRSTLALDVSLNDESSQLQAATREMVLDVLLITLSSAMLLFNLVMWRVDRDRFRFSYLIYLSGIILFSIYNSGLGYLYLWPNSPFFQQNAAFLGLAMFFWGGYSFCQHFLRTRTHYPRLHHVLSGLRWLGIASIPFGLLDLISQAVTIVTMANLIFFVVVIYLGVSATYKGLNSALLFMVSWSGMVICAVIYNLYVQGLLPSNFFVQRAMLIGVAYESLLISVAQATYLRNNQRERARSEAAAKNEALQALTKLDLALKDARDANRSKDEFLRLVSHELRTPITHSLGALDELANTPLKAGQQDLLHLLQNATHTTHHQVESLLSYAELLAYPVVSRPAIVDVRSRLQDSKQRLSAAFSTHGRLCTMKGVDTLPVTLSLDWHNTQHILDHLLDSALQHSQSGDIELNVHFDETAQRLNLTLHQPNPIDTVHTSPTTELVTADTRSASLQLTGPALNLYLSQAFADILGAELTREQHSDHILTRLSLPCTRAPEQKEPDTAGTTGVDTAPLAGCRVLVVEDNPLNLKLLTAILNREQCILDVAYDGVGAVEQASPVQYTFILMDCQMPKMDGFEATRLIRKSDGPNSNTPILAITANTMERDRNEAFAAGMDDLIPKPFSRPMLVERLLHWQTGRLT